MLNGIFLYFLISVSTPNYQVIPHEPIVSVSWPVAYQSPTQIPLTLKLELTTQETKKTADAPKTQIVTSIPTIALFQSPTPVPSPIPTETPVIPTETLEAPTVTSSPQVQSPPTEHEALFDQYSSQFGVDKEIMKKIAKCESGFNPGSRNGIYGGMFQFAEQTWIGTRNEMGLDTNLDLRFSAKDAIETAAYKISRAGTGPWRGCL